MRRRAGRRSALVLAARSAPVAAQSVGAEALHGGVPSGTAVPDVLELTLEQAITRGLEHNLGVILGQERAREAGASRREARSDLLPHVRAGGVRRAPEDQPGRLRLLGPRRLPGAHRPLQRGRRARLRSARPSSTCTRSRHAQSESLFARGRRAAAAQHARRGGAGLRAGSTCRPWRARAASRPRVPSSPPPRPSSRSPRTASSPASRPGIDVLRAQVQLAAQRQRRDRRGGRSREAEAGARARHRPAARPGLSPRRRHALRGRSRGSRRRTRSRAPTRRAPTSRPRSRASRPRSASAARPRARGCRPWA